ncbi:MAG TPA: single-stranded-DNA-specific exonuclease RecJ [Candidatus Paceibacterota bacterium]|nr:single-stranded-DNA-specific exonuclease RecJ [Candidatus Paceibacterota bacterium]
MHQYGELLKNLLENRGLSDEKQAEIFLNPSYERDFHDPFLMKDMQKACTRILEAIDKNEKTVVYADYDCDGIPGAVILNDLFKKLGYANFEIYIPERNAEGYGLNEDALNQFAESGTRLLITVDLGITAKAEVEYAKTKGIDVIITDHHIPPESLSPGESGLPDAVAILNPKTDEYPEKMLCGAGVVFKLAQGLVKILEIKRSTEGDAGDKKSGTSLESKVSPGWEKWLLDMAGLATLSDMVPLTGENRAIAHFGIKVLRKSPRPGLQKLLQKMKIDQRYLTADDLAFMVTPKINAASRMDSPHRAYELLSTDDVTEGGALADHLSKINDERKTLVTGIMREVNKNFEKRKLEEKIGDVIVIGNPTWKVGVLGLVASRISEEYERPVFVWGADEKDCIRGSCRSDGSVSLVELMTATRDCFTEFGGHEMAGGFSLVREKVHFLEETLSTAFAKVKKDKVGDHVAYDIKMTLREVNRRNWQEIEKMEPFGLGNHKPVFLFESVKIDEVKKFGKNGGEHLEISFSDASGGRVKAISFFSGEDSFSAAGATLQNGGVVNLIATFDLSRFRGREELRLRIVDII